VSGDHDGSFLVHFFCASKRCAGHRSRRSRTTSWKLFSLRLYWGDVCADAEHLPDHGVCDVVTQVDQREQHFLIRIELAPPAAAGTALASGLGLLCGETPGSEFGQHCGTKQAEGGRLQAQQGTDTIFGKRL